MAYHIENGQTSTGIKLEYNDEMRISSGGVANSTTVNSRGSMFIESGGTANSTTVNSGGHMYISSGGVANSTVVNSRGWMYISSGGVANRTTVNDGYMDIYSGGEANSTVVNASGHMFISSGGVANSTVVNSSGWMDISSGGVANDTINNGGRMYISSGGVANDTINNGGPMGIYSGGVANRTTVDGGFIYISSGGTANSTTVNDGYMDIYSGGVANDTINNGGQMDISSGGVANSTVVNSGGKMDIYSGGVANDTINNDGWMYISSGVANSTVVNSSGRMGIENGGVANSTVVNSGGRMYIDGGGVANDTTINNGGSMDINSGGVANSTVVNSSGWMGINYGGVANDTTINNGGQMYISSGGVANSTVVNSSGWMGINYGGVANDTTINNGGQMYISSGGVANSTVVNSGGSMYISSGGVANSTVVNFSGWMGISSGGTATDVIWTPCEGDIRVYDGAYVTYASNYTGVYFGSNNQLLSSAQTMDNKVVSGTMYVMNEGVANSTVVNSGGSMYIWDGGVHRGSLQIKNGAVVSAYEGGVIDFTIAGCTTKSDYLISDLSKISGTPTYTITVSSYQEYGEYKLAQGAENFTGTITIGNGSKEFGTVTVNGEEFVYDKVAYTLTQDDGLLKLTIYNSEYIFISSKFNEKTTGKKQDGVLLEYGRNAFTSINDVDYSGNKTIILLDGKNSGDYSDRGTVAGTVLEPVIKETDNSYSYKANSAPKGTLNLTADTGSTEFIRFASVNITSATVGNVTGGNTKETFNSKLVDGETKDQKTISEVNDSAAAGSITLKNQAYADTISGYSNVTLTDSTVGKISNYTSKDSKSETATYDEAKNTVTRKVTLSHTETTAGTLKANDSTLSDVTGFATVTLQNVTGGADFSRLDEAGEKYSTVKETLNIKTNKDGSVTGTYSKTETFTRSGKFTATGSVVGDIENFSNVTLDGSTAGAVSNFETAKIVTSGTALWNDMDDYGRPEDYDLNLDAMDLKVTETKSLNGSVTLKNNAYAESIESFQNVTMTGSDVGTISKVTKVTVNKGDSSIGSYIGTDGNDTLNIAKGAVLTANQIVLGEGVKDTLAINGTLILTGSADNLPLVEAAKITGKGEIAVVEDLFDDVSVDFANILNVGKTAENFRGTAYENADDNFKKAVKWDGATEYDGWLGDWTGYTKGSDDVDYIKFKAVAGDELIVDGISNWTLLDKKGNDIGKEITAAGEYILKLESASDTPSGAYTITLA